MLTGLLHLHRTLGYAVFFIALVNLGLALSVARTDPRAARVLNALHKFGLLMAGRLNIVLGFALWFMLPQYTVATWWIWVSLLLWGPVEAVAVRMVKPEVALVQDGGTGSGRLLGGATLQLLIIVAIFGLMSARP